jgi:hypothetical protein
MPQDLTDLPEVNASVEWKDTLLISCTLFLSPIMPGHLKKLSAKLLALAPHNKKAHSSYWNRLLKGFSSVRPHVPHRAVAILATVSPSGLASVTRMIRHCRAK